MDTTTTTKPLGRPRKAQSKGVSCFDSRLYQFLQAKLPHFVIRGRLSVGLLADEINHTPQSLYRWFRDERISPDAAQKVVDVSRRKLTLTDLVPFFISQ